MYIYMYVCGESPDVAGLSLGRQRPRPIGPAPGGPGRRSPIN